MRTLAVLAVFFGIMAAAAVFWGGVREKEHKQAFVYESIQSAGRVMEYASKNKKLPATLEEAGLKPHIEQKWDLDDTGDASLMSRDIELKGGTMVVTYRGIETSGLVTLVMQFSVGPDGVARMDCTGGTLSQDYRYSSCKK